MGSSFILRTAVLFGLASTTVACGSDKDVQKVEDPDDQTPEADAGESPDFPQLYLGEVTGTDAQVAVFVSDSDHFKLYVCGGSDTVGTLTHWFTQDGTTTEDGFSYSVVITPGGVQGKVVSPYAEEDHPFTAHWVDLGGIAGLYEATAPCGKVGFIVNPADGEDAPRTQGTCNGADIRDSKQVNPILPLTLAKDGALTVQVDGETDSVMVRPASF